MKPIQAASSLSAAAPAINYSLYLVDRAGNGGGLALEYQWDTATYFFTGVTGANSLPDATLVSAAISTFALSGNLGTQYVIVNAANGLVMTDMGGGNGMVAMHLASGNANQLWALYLDDGSGNCSTYVPQASGSPGVNCTVDGNYPGTACGSGIYAISSQQLGTTHSSGYWNISGTSVGSAITTNGGAGCAHCNNSCSNAAGCDYTNCGGGPSPWDLFFLVPWNSGTMHAIYNYAGSQGGAVSWVVTDPTVTGANLPPPGYGNSPDGGPLEEGVVVGGNSGQANELWVFIPAGNVETSQ